MPTPLAGATNSDSTRCYESDQVNQEMFPYRRSFLREMFSHGFRAFLGLVSIGNFGRKLSVLKRLSASVI